MANASSEKRPVIIGESRPTEYSPIMMLAAAKRYADRVMANDLRRAGFKASVFISDPDLHGGSWFRVCHGKRVSA